MIKPLAPVQKPEPQKFRLSVCINQMPVSHTDQLLDRHWQYVNALASQSSHNLLFLKGAAVNLLHKPDQLISFINELFPGHLAGKEPRFEVLACSSAVSKLNISLDQISGLLPVAIAGLGSWIEAACSGISFDFSTMALLPEFVVINADPEIHESMFNEQLDLALAAAAFDLEPTLLLTEGAARAFQAHTQSELAAPSWLKKLRAAALYGVKTTLIGSDAMKYLKTFEFDACHQIHLLGANRMTDVLRSRGCQPLALHSIDLAHIEPRTRFICAP